MSIGEISEHAMIFICNELGYDASKIPTEIIARKHLLVCARLLMASLMTAECHGFIKTDLNLIGFKYHLEKFLTNLEKERI